MTEPAVFLAKGPEAVMVMTPVVPADVQEEYMLQSEEVTEAKADETEAVTVQLALRQLDTVEALSESQKAVAAGQSSSPQADERQEAWRSGYGAEHRCAGAGRRGTTYSTFRGISPPVGSSEGGQGGHGNSKGAHGCEGRCKGRCEGGDVRTVV